MRNSLSDVWRYVAKGEPDECWPWTAGRHKFGYGKFKLRGETPGAHRIVYELTYGPPGDEWVLHACDNPPCCNPAHLFLGDALANAQDREAKGRGFDRYGETSTALLSPAQVAVILAMDSCNVRLNQIAAYFGVDPRCISAIVNGRTWSREPRQPRPPRVGGENNHNAKLTVSDVREIRRMKAEGIPQREIAEHFGTSASRISRIVNQQQWREVA